MERERGNKQEGQTRHILKGTDHNEKGESPADRKGRKRGDKHSTLVKRSKGSGTVGVRDNVNILSNHESTK